MVASTDLENKYLTLPIWHRIEIRDEVRVLTCSLKVKFESNIIPRALTEDTGIKCYPRKETLISSTLLFRSKENKFSFVWINQQLICAAPRSNKSEIFRDFCKAGVFCFSGFFFLFSDEHER